MADRAEIDEVRARTDIVSIVEQHVTLKRAGRNLKGLCPFHSEKTPSFQVNPDLGLWRCFGQCGEGGDVFKFVEKIENLSFGEALERLAMRAGITLTRSQGNGEGRRVGPQETSERDRLYKVNRLALDYYREQLKLSEVAQDYLQKRGVLQDAQEAFFIGYAQDSWDGLTKFLMARGTAPGDAELAGLISRSDRGTYFDKMRGRIIFPILDVQERPIAFGGRVIEDRPGQPKYWNSPETPVFSKSRTLYGLWRARKAIADQGKAIVVEGYTDVVAAHQAGFQNVVATLGTSLTEEHVKILERLAPMVLLAFDADSAGLKAAFRAADIFAEQKVEARVLDLPEGEDPDSLLKSGKRDVLAEVIENAVPMITYRIKRLIRKNPIKTDQDRIVLFREAIPILSSIPSVIEREQYIKQLAAYHPQYSAGAAFAEEQIRQEIVNSRAKTASVNGYSEDTGGRRDIGTRSKNPAPAISGTIAERYLLQALTSGELELAAFVLSGIAPEEFVTPEARALALHIYAFHGATGSLDPSAIVSSVIDENLAGFVNTLVMEERQPLSVQMLDDGIKYLRMRSMSLEVKKLKELIDRGDASEEDFKKFLLLNSQLKGS